MRYSFGTALLTLLFLWVTASIVIAGQQQFHDFDIQDRHYHFDTSEGLYVLKFYSPEIVEVNFHPAGQNKELQNDSHAVILEPGYPEVRVIEGGDSVALHTRGLSVIYDTGQSAFSFFYQGERLLQEHNGFTLNEDDEGYRVDFRISETEMLMGGGARAMGMNRRGHMLELYNRAHYGYETRSELMNYTLPLVLSSKKYAVHFDNPTIGYLDLDSQNDHTLGFEAYSGRMTYQVIAGEKWENIMDSYTSLTGRQPLPPLWTFGNFSSRFGYHTQEEVMETIARFREEEIPVDAVILDLFWFGQEIKGTMGNLAFDRETFPEPARMVSELKQDGVKTVLITEPFVLTTSDRWDEVVEADILAKDTLGQPATYDFYFGNTGLIDVFKPEGQQWFWNIYQELKETYGIHGWWGDLGEPEVHPYYLRHYSGKANEVHNIYGHQWAKLVYDNSMAHYPEERPFNLMRAGYSGSQRYGMIPWSGDVNRSWGGLKPQPEISLQMGMQGLAYMHSDLGGFAGDLLDDELYVRWMQYGVFQPVYRPHAQEETPSEPVFRSRKAMELSKKAIELRYRLLPYIYTAAFHNSQNGMPFMRPLFFEEPENYKLYNVAETYLFGDDLLISPVLRQGERFVTVHVPGHDNWFDYYTSQKYEGGRVYEVSTSEDLIPTLVRGGAVIPLADLVQTTDDYSVDHLTLRYFFDEKAAPYQTQIYHDDGVTSDAYAKGAYEILHFFGENHKDGDQKGVELVFEHENGGNMPVSFSQISLQIFNSEKEPRRIELDGQPLGFDYQKEDNLLMVETFELDAGRHTISISF